MNKLIILIPLLMLSCNKKETVSETSANSDSVIVSDGTSTANMVDSTEINDSIITASKTKEAMREIDGNKIIRIADAADFPFTIDEEFTNENQEFILKIKNFNTQKISGKIKLQNQEMNIRFNQIKLPNGDYDGPFGREISYKIKEKGEIWLIIGKSNMASGETKGKFSVNIQ